MNHSRREKSAKFPVWDLPTRLFHWLLATTVVSAWLTSTTLYFEAHLLTGYLLAMLLLFRLLWGFVGGHYARFRHFAYPWSALQNHLRQLFQTQRACAVGHNPAAGWMVYLLLGNLLLITISGFLTLGGEEQSGPLRGWLTIEWGAAMHQLHERLSWLMIALITLHLLGVVIEQRLSRQRLIQAMITGSYHSLRTAPGGIKIRAVATLLLATPLLAYQLSLITPDNPAALYPHDWRAESGFSPWREECGGCHTLHHPSLLPARSWQQMMTQTGDHFGEDLALDGETHRAITEFLQHHGAEFAYSEAAWMTLHSLQPQQAPLQVTQTPYWRERHQQIDPAIWRLPSIAGPIHCDGCHQDAADGLFQNRAIAIPGV